MDSFTLSSRALDLVARLRLQLQELAPTEAALARGRFALEALTLCEAHFDDAAPSADIPPAGSSAGLESPDDAQAHLSLQEWSSGATFAICGRRLSHPIALDDPIRFTECPECFGRQPLNHPQILTADEASALPRMPRAD